MKNIEDLLDSAFTGEANGEVFRKTRKAGVKAASPAFDGVLSATDRKIMALQKITNDPGASAGERANAEALIKKLRAKGGTK